MNLPPVPCVTAASEDKNNRSRHERRSLQWVAADAETLCCAHTHIRSVVEITRETTVLRGKNKGKTSIERIIYICSLEPDAARGDEHFHDAMNRFNHRLAFATITARHN